MAGRRRSEPVEHAERAAAEEPALPWVAPAPGPARSISVPEDPPGRPWSLSAAREPVYPLAPVAAAAQQAPASPPTAPGAAAQPPGPGAAAQPPGPAAASEPRAGAAPTALPDDASAGPSWTLTVVVAVALVVALGVLITSHLHLGSTAAPALGINGLAAVRGDVPANLPEGHFPSSATRIDVGCDYVGASPGQVVQFVITLQPASRGSGVVTLPTQSHTFIATNGQTGHIIVSIAPQNRGFIPGTYTVDAQYGGRSLRSTEFTVEVAQPQPTPTPVGV